MRRVRDGFCAGLHLISHHERTMSNLAHAWVIIWYTGSALAVTFHVGHVHPLLGPLTCSLYRQMEDGGILDGLSGFDRFLLLVTDGWIRKSRHICGLRRF